MSVRADELARVRSPGGAPAGSLLRAYGFRRLLIGQSVSSLGDWVATLAFISAAMNAGLPLGRGARHSELQLFRDLLEGVRYIVRHPALRSLSYGLVVSMFGGGVLFAVGIGYVHQTLGGSDAAFGWLAALWGAGMALGLGAVRLLPGGGRPREFLAAVVACGLVLGLMAMAPVLWMAFVAAVVFGMAFAVAIVLALTMAQEQADNRVRGRVMGGVQMLFRAGLGLGAAAAGGVLRQRPS